MRHLSLTPAPSRAMRVLTMFAVLALVSAQCASAEVSALPKKAGYKLSKVDEGKGWCPCYFGNQSAKVVFDGDAYYTLGLWGDTEAKAQCFLYKSVGDKWVRGQDGRAHV